MSLRRYLTRLIWLSLLPLILLASYLAVDNVRTRQAERALVAANVAQNFVIAIDHNLNARIGALRMLASSPLATDVARRAEFYQAAQGFYGNFGSHVVLADLGMQMLFTTRVPLGTLLPRLPVPTGRAAVPIALATGAPAVGDLFFGPVAKEPLLALAVPVKRDDKTLFVLLSTFEARYYQQRLEQINLPGPWVMALLDGTGAAIAQRVPAGFGAATDVDEIGRFVVKSSVAPWSVRVEIPRANYLAPLIPAAAALALLIVGAALAGVLGGTLGRRRLEKSLIALTQPAPSGAQLPDATQITEIATVQRLLEEAAQARAIAQARLRESEREILSAFHRFETIFLGAPEAMSVSKLADGRLLQVNDAFCQTFGYAREDLIGHTSLELGLWTEPSRRSALTTALREGRQVRGLEGQARRRSGELREVRYSGEMIQLDGDPCLLLMFHDITEQKRAEQQVHQLNAELEQRVAERTAALKQVNQELETFAYSVSHDLKAPLRGIDGYSQLLQEECKDQLGEDGRLFVANIRRGAHQMNTLIEDLLAYSRIERRVLHSAPLALAELVQAVLAEQAQEIDRLQATVQVTLPPLTVLADRDGVAIVLRNLLANALKFFPRGRQPQIEIGGHEEAAGCTLWLRDDGIGFDMKFHDRIFEIFQRLQRTEDYDGTGIGLALVSKAVQRMGGRVWAQSSPGAGATFFVTLPKFVATPVPATSENTPETSKDGHDNC